MKITYIGHAGFKIEDDVIAFFDPWLSAPTSKMKIEDIEKCNFVFVTHDHGDHGLDEGIEIAKKTNATFVSIFELSNIASEKGVKNTFGMNIGGSYTLGNTKITMTQALHSSTNGSPIGFIVKFASHTIYHPGDTGLFGDMKLLGEIYHPDVALLPIGSTFTMGPKEAAIAAKLLDVRHVIPMHYNTFPVIEQDPNEFAKIVKEEAPNVNVHILNPGETLEL